MKSVRKLSNRWEDIWRELAENILHLFYLRSCVLTDHWKKHCITKIFYKGICLHFLRISPYSVRMPKNADQNNSKYGHVLRSFGNQDKIYFSISFVGALKMRYSSSKVKFPQNATVFHNFILTHEIYYRITAFLYLLRDIFWICRERPNKIFMKNLFFLKKTHPNMEILKI